MHRSKETIFIYLFAVLKRLGSFSSELLCPKRVFSFFQELEMQREALTPELCITGVHMHV